MSNHLIKNTMADVERFKSAIPRVRDILRACSITGMDSMRHVCFYLLSRYITNKNVEKLNIPKHLSWENIFVKAFEDEDIALQLFKHDLIDQFDKLFETQQFSFEMKSGVKHKEILEIFNGISMEGIDLHMDILGYVYEQHLKTGSSAARDLGQFFTDRFICEYMVKICQPKFKLDGIPESVCDPTMGTGGFLTAYLKYFKNVDWSKYQTQIHGVDHDAKVAGVSRLNMFMESGGEIFKHLHTADSLHGGLNPTAYDIILANMPFGLKGLKYKDVHQSIKTLALDGTKSEPLFLQLMMVSLNKGGRCAVVVPDGMLVNNSKCHSGTRKYLIEHFELKRVIKMKGKFFMNTGIQPSILFFENSGKKTEEVEFWDVERDDKGTFSEKVVVSVPFEKFDDSYSLDMRKYQETEKKNYNEEFQLKKLEDICNHSNGKPITAEEKLKGGEYCVMGGGMDYNGSYTQYNREGETISISKSGASAGFVKYHNMKYWAGDCFTIVPNDNSLVTKYLYYYLSLNDTILKSKTSGSTIPHCKWDDVKDIQIPIPSLELQHQIVEKLDTVYESNQNASKMIENLKKQIKTVTNIIDCKNYDSKKLKDVLTKTGSGKTNSTSITNTGEYPFYGCTNIVPSGTHSSCDFDDDEYMLFAKSGGNAKSPISDDMGIGKFHYVKGKSAGNIAIYQFKKTADEINYKYLEYILKNKLSLIQSLAKYTTGNGNIDITNMMEMVEIPVPPLEVQMSIVERLVGLQGQINCLEQIESQADENAKFILDGYLGA